MHVRSRINVNEGTFSIECSAASTIAGNENPSIFKAEIAEYPIIVDGEHAKEGELVLSQKQYDESELIKETGELVVKPYDDDANNYFLDGVRLRYLDSTNEIQDIIIYPGNSFILNINPMLTGKIQFNNLSSEITGAVDLDYRITVDGLFWNDWLPINELITSGEQINVENNVEVQIRIRNIGNSDSVFTSLNLEGLILLNTFIAPTLNERVFGKILGTPEQVKLEVNLFKKLYFRGILPQYIQRGENRSYKEDEDFVLFFKSVARYFSLIVSFFKRWENWRNDFDMLREQLIGYGIYFDENTSDLETLQLLCQTIYSIAQQRGTEMIFSRRGIEKTVIVQYPSYDNSFDDSFSKSLVQYKELKVIDGEFLRLTRNRVCDEVDYDYIPKWNVGWCMGHGSPMYAGTCQSYELNKTLENTKDFQSLDSLYTDIKNGGEISFVTIDNKRSLCLHTSSSGDVASIGRIETNDPLEEDNIIYTADTQMDYEITFAVMVTDNSFDKSTLRFGVEGFDINKIKQLDAFVEPSGTVVSEQFFDVPLGKFVEEEWYYVRGIIHAYSTVNKEEIVTNIGFGTDLYFNNPFVKYMMPSIQLVSNDAGNANVYIWDYKIRPLVRGRNIMPLKSGELDYRSLGFLQFGRFFYTYFRNRNNTKSVDEVTSIIEKYLYPFDSVNLFTITGNKN